MLTESPPDIPSMLPATIGPYRIVRQLGEGGMGVVYEGINDAIERRVAIKVLRPDYAKNKDVTARFVNEARAVNRIEHPSLVQVSDYAELPDGSAYIVMEYLRGESLAARIERLGGRLPVGNALQITWQIADALVAAHDKSIVHRDLKPENVMLVADKVAPGGERAKLLDFGIAKLAEAAQGGNVRTSTNMMMGTPRYMAPEQCRGASEVDHKADVYALGVMLYRMLSGQYPFDGAGIGEIIAKQIYEPPPPLRDIAPELPEDLVALVHSLLAKEREQRLAMADVFAQLVRLLPAHAAQPLPVPPVRFSGAIAMGAASAQFSTLSEAAVQTQQPLVKRRWFRAGAGISVAVAAIAGIAVLMPRAPKTPYVKADPPVGDQYTASAAPAPKRPLRKVRWSITTEPTAAEVVRVRDGAVLGRTPWSTQQEAAPGEEELLLRLPGFEERSVTLQRSGHEQITEALEPGSVKSRSASSTENATLRPVRRKSPSATTRKKKEVRLEYGTVPTVD